MTPPARPARRGNPTPSGTAAPPVASHGLRDVSADPAPPGRIPGEPQASGPFRHVALQRHAAQPLHEQIERVLRDQIASGELPAHYRLPPEPELSRQWGVNRGTLRRALAPLAAEGLLIAQRGRGTFVAPAAPQSSIAQHFLSLSEDLIAQGHAVDRTVLSVRQSELPARVRAAFGLGERAEGLDLVRVFSGADGPLAYLRNYVRADRCPDLARIDFGAVPLFDVLAQRYGLTITHGRRTFRAQLAGGAVAGALRLAVGAPVLHLEQVSFAGQQPVEFSDVYLDSSKVALTSRLERTTPGVPPA